MCNSCDKYPHNMTHKFRKETVSPQTLLCANYGLTFYLFTLLSLNFAVIPSNHFFLPVQPSKLLGVEQRTYFILNSRRFSEEMSSRSAASISFDDPLDKVKCFVIEKGLMVRFLSFVSLLRNYFIIFCSFQNAYRRAMGRS